MTRTSPFYMFFPPSLKYSEPSIVIHFDNVPTNRTTEIIPDMMEIVHKVIADGPEKCDTERIHNNILKGLILNQKESENSPHGYFPGASMLDMMYGQSQEHFQTFVRASQGTGEYLQVGASCWLGLMEDTFVNR